jgi:hypothetical protein
MIRQIVVLKRQRLAGQHWVPAFAGMSGCLGRYFFPGGEVKAEPAVTAGFGFSALGFRVSLLLRT